jgi:hypothetical protein
MLPDCQLQRRNASRLADNSRGHASDQLTPGPGSRSTLNSSECCRSPERGAPPLIKLPIRQLLILSDGCSACLSRMPPHATSAASAPSATRLALMAATNSSTVAFHTLPATKACVA